MSHNIEKKYSHLRAKIVDWTKLKNFLDLRKGKKNKYEILALWKDATMVEETWVSQGHITERLTSYVKMFKVLHQKKIGNNKKAVKNI